MRNWCSNFKPFHLRQCVVCVHRNYYTDFSHYSSRDEPDGTSCSVTSKMPEGLHNRLERVSDEVYLN